MVPAPKALRTHEQPQAADRIAASIQLTGQDLVLARPLTEP
jgi:hypothetical protein